LLLTPLEGAPDVQPAELEPYGTCGLDVRVDGLLAVHAVPRLCEQLAVMVDCAGVVRLRLDLGRLDEPDLATLDALARLALAARRRDASVTVRTANGALERLLGLAGLGALVAPT
jgi:ABC-type transporter Mla MlaB component